LGRPTTLVILEVTRRVTRVSSFQGQRALRLLIVSPDLETCRPDRLRGGPPLCQPVSPRARVETATASGHVGSLNERATSAAAGLTSDPHRTGGVTPSLGACRPCSRPPAWSASLAALRALPRERRAPAGRRLRASPWRPGPRRRPLALDLVADPAR